jgi:glutamine transport system substrate-binding protein
MLRGVSGPPTFSYIFNPFACRGEAAMKRTPWIIFIIILVSLMLGACGQAAQPTASSGGAGLGGKTLTVAHDVNFPPFEFLQNDKYTGFDLDLLNAIAEKGNFKVDTRAMDFNGIIPALQSNQVDMAIAAMTIKPERAQVIDFSIPYFRTGLVLAVKPDNTSIVNPEDLKGKSIAVKIGTSGEAYIRGLAYASEIKIETFDSNNDTYLAVINGNVDVTINDDSTLKYYIASEGQGKLKVVGELLTGDNYGIAIPKGNADRLKAVNDSLLALVKDGTYDQLYEKWFGTKPTQRPGEFQ